MAAAGASPRTPPPRPGRTLSQPTAREVERPGPGDGWGADSFKWGWGGVTRVARQVAHSLCPCSPASAWSPSSPNALYRGISRPLSPHRMADGGSPFLGRRDFVYPFSPRGKDQILSCFLTRRPPLCTTYAGAPRGGRETVERPALPGCPWGRADPLPARPAPRRVLPKLSLRFSTDPSASERGVSPARKEEKKVRGWEP